MQKTVASIISGDLWSVAEGTHNDLPLVIRFRPGFSREVDVSAFPHRVLIVWRFRTGAKGLPDLEAATPMRDFEDRLLLAVENEAIAVLTAVITGEWTREWVFYAADAARFDECFQAAAPSPASVQLTIENEDDAGWSYLFDDILAGVSA